MRHELLPLRPHLHAHYAAAAAPVLTVESGDTVCVSTPDVSWGLEPPTSTIAPRKKIEPRDPARDNGPCLCGPIAIRGALPGDTLQIDILRITPAEWGWTYAGGNMVSPAYNAALGLTDAPLTLLRWIIDRAAHTATNQLGHTVPLRPFFGTIGLAPAQAHASGWEPTTSGGNMDCNQLTAGTTLYLPVAVTDGLLSMGDGHAAQANGELSGTAIECPIETAELRLTIRRDMPIKSPRARTATSWVTMGFGPTLDTAAVMAASSMLDLLVDHLHIPRAEALALASTRVDLHITQMVNPLKGVHAILHD